MKTLRPLASLALVLGTAAVFQAPAARAQQQITVAPYPAPTIINSVPYTITASGLYQLGANFNYSTPTGAQNEAIITVAAPNVTLDFAGHYLSGPTASGQLATTLYGVYCNEVGNVTIQNGTISHCFIGAVFNGNGSSTTANINPVVQNMLFNACYNVGVYLNGSINGQVTSNRFTSIGGSQNTRANNQAYAVDIVGNYLNQANNNIITNFTTAGANYGIVGGAATTANFNTISQFSGSGYGINGCAFARGNRLANLPSGLNNCAKYEDNLTYRVNTPFSGGTAVSGNASR